MYRNSWKPKPQPNQTSTPCNNKSPNIAIHIHYPIATLFGDGTSRVEGESGGPLLYRNSWGPKTKPNQHTMQHQEPKHSHTHRLPHSSTVWGWHLTCSTGIRWTRMVPQLLGTKNQTKPTQHTMHQQEPKHSHTHTLPHSNTVWGWDLTC